MTVRRCFAGLLLSLLLTGTGRADEKAALKKIEAADTAAMAAYKTGNAERAKDQLLDAIVLGKENGLEAHAVMARVYLHLAAVQAEGLKDEEKAKRYFSLAVRIQPDIQATGTLATPAVVGGLERARDAARAPAAPPATGPTPAAAGAAPSEEDKEQARQAERAAAEARARDKMAATVLKEKEREVKEQEQKAREERDKLGKDLAVLQDREKREREGREKLQAEKQELEKQLAEAKESGEEGAGRERPREPRQPGPGEAADRRPGRREEGARGQGEAPGRRAGTSERASQEKAARDKLAEGPDVPSSIPQPIFCPTQDEWSSGTDVFVHCAPQSQVKAKELALYYRPSGAVHYNSLLWSGPGRAGTWPPSRPRACRGGCCSITWRRRAPRARWPRPTARPTRPTS